MTFQALVHICLCKPVLGVDVPSHSEESADFVFVSCNDNACRSLSLSRASGCDRSPSSSLVRLETRGRVSHAIGLTS